MNSDDRLHLSTPEQGVPVRIEYMLSRMKTGAVSACARASHDALVVGRVDADATVSGQTVTFVPNSAAGLLAACRFKGVNHGAIGPATVQALPEGGYETLGLNMPDAPEQAKSAVRSMLHKLAELVLNKEADEANGENHD